MEIRCTKVVKQEGKKKRSRGPFAIEKTRLQNGPIIIEKEIPIAMLAKRLSHCEYEAVPENALAKIRVAPCGSGVLVGKGWAVGVREGTGVATGVGSRSAGGKFD